MQPVPEPNEISESAADQAGRTAPSIQSITGGQPDMTFAPAVSGIDFEIGLRRAMGMKPSYLSMLQGFVETRRDSAENIRLALDLQDLKKAELLSHSLFGLAAQIGATRVPQDAQALEQAISAQHANDLLEPLLDKLRASLSELMDGLDHYLLRMSGPI